MDTQGNGSGIGLVTGRAATTPFHIGVMGLEDGQYLGGPVLVAARSIGVVEDQPG